ncbi:S-layer family protein [Nostoc sp.]|uniref:S-layer family protein n=1 Tax=Nostoc sp. TaxID=1180 RepID=UPI002FF8633E
MKLAKASFLVMKAVPFLFILTSGLLTSGMLLPAILLWSRCAIAQVTSDGTTNTTVKPNGNNFIILNGIEKGNNLFHSFSNFSVPIGGSARFDLINTPNITTIFSRVTGGNVSKIDGLISTLNSINPVSLFLMNPAGIVFSKNASLDIGGSFLGTTANSILFGDGTEFSATNPNTTPLLTISVPIGLQFGSKPGEITLAGTGHLLTAANNLAPLTPTGINSGLSVKPGNSIALVGGMIDLTGGVLTAPGGRVELGSLANQGFVHLNLIPQGFALDYTGVQSFGDIELSQQSLADVSGTKAGSIQVQGGQVSLKDGSILFVQNRGIQPAGDISVDAAKSLLLTGTTSDKKILSGLLNQTVAPGAGGNIIVSTPQLTVQAGASIATPTYTSGTGGNIAVNAKQLEISGFAPNTPNVFSSIASVALGSGKGGDVTISTQQLSVLDGGFLGTSTLGNGASGNVSVNADAINISGTTTNLISSLISATSGGSGNAGNLNINTRTLTIQNSGAVTTASISTGSAGSVTVNASESIDINGRVSEKADGSAISSVVTIPSPSLKKLLRLPEGLSGTAGSVTINTPVLNISNYGAISVSNQGIGNAGTLKVNASSVLLNNNATIDAFTFTGEGSKIDIQANILQLRHGSSITATALSNGNGGNINIKAPIILGIENSDIIANALEGKGGNIQITTQGIFGLKYHPQLTSENDITASSRFGVNGNVQIISPDINPNSGLIQLPTNLVDSSQQIARGCANTSGSSFVATGRGGVPQNPNQQVMSDRTWSDIRDISAYRKSREVQAKILSFPEVLVQASGWYRNAQGKIELVADKSPTYLQQPLTCAAIPKS